jgi:hypothetical protein
VTQVRNELAQQIDKTLSNLEETAPIDIIEEDEGVLDLEEGTPLLKIPKTDEKIAVTSTMHFSYRNAIKVR